MSVGELKGFLTTNEDISVAPTNVPSTAVGESLIQTLIPVCASTTSNAEVQT